MASQTACPEHFANGQAPDFINQKLSSMTRDVCYSGFAIKHSGVTRTPLYAAEHLTRERLQQGKGLKRQSQFHPDEHIPTAERAELHHYARSGYYPCSCRYREESLLVNDDTLAAIHPVN